MIDKETFDIFAGSCLAILIWTASAWWMAYGLFPVKNPYACNKIRFYIKFPKMCSLTLAGTFVKWLVIYPLTIVLNIVYITTTLPVPVSIALVYIICHILDFLEELFKVYKGFFKYCMCKKFKASDIHCYKW